MKTKPNETHEPALTEAEETRRGQMLCDILYLSERQNFGIFYTTEGLKSPLEIYRTAKRIVEEGK